MLLKTIMEQQGFRNYDQEWWHFTLNDEPFHDKYFYFLIEQSTYIQAGDCPAAGCHLYGKGITVSEGYLMSITRGK